MIEILLKDHFLNVQFFHDQWYQVTDQCFIFAVYQHFRKRLTYFDPLFFTRTATEPYQGSDDIHTFFHALVYQGQIGLREEGNVNGIFTGQIGIDLIRDERCDRCDQFGNADQDLISRRVNTLLVFRQFFCIESTTCTTDIPVGQIFCHKIGNRSDGSHMVILIHIFRYIVYELIVFAEDPAIEFRSLCIVDRKGSRIDIILICVKDKEVIYVPQGSEELADHVFEAFFVELGRRPCRRYGQQIPSGRIRAVFIQHFKRRYGIALVLGHLFTLFVEDQVVDQYVSVWRTAFDNCRNCHQRIEPASGLVDAFADEVCREQLIKVLRVFKRIMPLCERHGTGVKPAVHNFRDSVHRLAAFRAGQGHIIHIRSVQLDRFIDIFVCQFHQLFPGADAVQMTAFASPDRDRRAPVSGTGDRPVFDFCQPVAETLFADIFRIPVDCIIVCNELILQLGHFDIPGWLCIINQRRIASPAVRIVML